MSELDIAWAVLTGLCFMAGLVWSWRRAKRRINDRVVSVIDDEIQDRVAQEVLRQLKEGPVPPQR